MDTTLDVVEGMQFDRGYLSPYFVTDPDRMEVSMEDPYILLVEKKVSNIKEILPLLEKVEEVIEMFPDAQLMVEGHTDASGDAGANMDLSERRAYAVMQYLRQSLLIPASQVSAMGFGADRPVASNRTDEGRAKNRRIDIIIMR